MSQIRAYAQLVRLPNVFTTCADIALGFAVALATGSPVSILRRLPILLLASASLYCAGMVWNDFFDLAEDRRDRPFRPLPSGRISKQTAALLGAALMALGMSLALAADLAGPQGIGPATVAGGLLVVLILAYDAWLKHTWLGPIAMGGCRFLDILLGLSVCDPVACPWGLRLHLALAVGVYITGTTIFARREAAMSDRSTLTLGSWVGAAGLVIALGVPVWFPPGTSFPLYPILLVVFGFWLASAVVPAVRNPRSNLVQNAVRQAILGLILFDALLASAVLGWLGLLLSLLILPGRYLGRWIYST